MELFALQQDGTETHAGQLKVVLDYYLTETSIIILQVNNLRLEAARSGLVPSSRPPRGRGGFFRGRGRGFSPRGSMSFGGYRGG